MRRFLGKSIQDWFFWFIWFFSRFLGVPSPNCPKTRGKPKKTKKTILWEESWVSPFRIVFGLFGFFEVFCCPKPNCPKTRGTPKKTKKTILWEEFWVSPFRIGFFGLFGFSQGFCCPKPNCPKIGGNRIIFVEKRKNTYIYICICIRLYGTDYPIIYLKEVGSRKKLEEKNDLQRKYLKGNGV